MPTADKNEKITITCPLCRKTHAYLVEVESSMVMAMLSPHADPKPRQRRFVRIFTCPAEKKRFQATLTFSEDFLEKIKGVTVKGLDSDE